LRPDSRIAPNKRPVGVIPNRSNRKQRFSFSKRKRLCKLPWRIDSAFNRLKDFGGIATRYDKLARNYLASVSVTAPMPGWRMLCCYAAMSARSVTVRGN
jgi:transposase